MVQKQLKLLNLITKSSLPSPVFSYWEKKIHSFAMVTFFKVNLMLLPDGQPEIEKLWRRHWGRQITILDVLGSLPMLIEMVFFKTTQSW